MIRKNTEKPEYDEWLHWAQVTVDRLLTCTQVYSRPQQAVAKSALSAETRQHRNAEVIDLLRRFEAMTDESDRPSDSLDELDQHGERVIDGLAVLFGEALSKLPGFSADMQKLLKSPWKEKCNGRLADELFRGPMGNEPEGIGSGRSEDGRLPMMLEDLLEREKAGKERLAREMLGAPRREDAIARRWGERNSRILRSAGRVE